MTGPVNIAAPAEPAEPNPAQATLARRLGFFDATMIVMGGIIGAGIFVNPSVVARAVHTPALVLGAWIIGGAIALIGAFVYAELAVMRPRVGGQYAYLRDAYHPIVAFLYGWTLLLVIQTGGMAGAAIIFGRYFHDLTGWAIPEQIVAATTLAVLTIINCVGVRAGSNVQSALMLTKLAAIGMLIVVGLFGVHAAAAPSAAPTDTGGMGGLAAAMVPVLFAYGGWQTASFVSGEMRDARRDLPRGLLVGVVAVIILYLTVTWVCINILGVTALAATRTPASDVMRLALGERGARILALGIAVSTVGFLSQSILTAPRVYYAMARDGVFFGIVGTLGARSRVPVVAIVLQGVWAAAIALTGKYDQILNYVVAIDVLFFGLTGASLIVFRRREGAAPGAFRVPLHPVTTGLFVLACWAISVTTVMHDPSNAGIGVGILLLGIVVYQFWKPRAASTHRSSSAP
ncbi:MAG TPA: amino acid permease [Gemmatimonadaceae bacterium]|jgi:APA family basic amino acid/polyamine antiporter|nr:amino acid permease [Gemmatimonadaceae bacterium]